MDTYYIIFKGELLPGFNLDEVKRAFTDLEQVPASLTEEVFSEKYVVLRVNPSTQDISAYYPALARIGMKASMEKEAPQKALYLQELKGRHSTGGQNHLLERPKVQDYSRYYEGACFPPKLFGMNFEGRYGRLNYINATLLLFLAFVLPYAGVFLLGLAVGGRAAAVIVFIGWSIISLFLTFFWFRLSALRLHDLNQSGVIMLIIMFCSFMITAIPFTLIPPALASLLLFILPGTSGVNKYGPPARQGSFAGLFIYLLLIPLVILFMVASSFTEISLPFRQ